MPTDTQKAIAGALLTGASLLSGNAVLMTVAGGIGVNWTSEGLAGLWQQAGQAFAGGTPVSRAGERAIRRAVDELRREYRQQVGAQVATETFDLVRACAPAVVAIQPVASGEPISAQSVLATSLTELLHGHDERQVRFLKDRLLEAVALHFRNELAADDEAWHLFHGWLIEQLNAQMIALRPALDRLPEVLARLGDVSRATTALEDATERLDALLDELRAAIQRLDEGQTAGTTTFSNTDMEIGGKLDQAGVDVYRRGARNNASLEPPSPSTRSTSFINQGVKVKGDVTQAGRNIYAHPARAQSDAPAAPGLSTPHSSTNQSSPLTLTFTPSASGATVDWESDVIGTIHSSLVAPYAGDDLALVMRALDVLQYPNYPHAQTETQRLRFTFNPDEQTRLTHFGLWDATGRVRADAHRQVGRALYTALTTDLQGAQALSTARNHATATGEPLALALRFPSNVVELAALPWELLWADEPTPLLLSRGALAPCTRHLDLAQALPFTRPRRGPLHILTIAPQANIPVDVRAAERAARMATWQPLLASKQVTLDEVSPATRAAVVDAVHRQPPDIIHYYGHGRYTNDVGALLFDQEDGGKDWIDVARLMTLFGGARLVALHACQGAMVGGDEDTGLLTGIAPALSAAGVPVVIGMQLAMRITAATRACGVIYRALAAGRSAQEAVSQARQALYVEETDQSSWYVPTLYIRTSEIKPVYF